MQTATLKQAAEELGVTPDDIVHYHKEGNKAIIEIDLKLPGVQKAGNSALDVFDKIVAMSEDVGIRDWSLNHDHYLYGTPRRNHLKSDD